MLAFGATIAFQSDTKPELTFALSVRIQSKVALTSFEVSDAPSENLRPDLRWNVHVRRSADWLYELARPGTTWFALFTFVRYPPVRCKMMRLVGSTARSELLVSARSVLPIRKTAGAAAVLRLPLVAAWLAVGIATIAEMAQTRATISAIRRGVINLMVPLSSIE